MVLSTSRECGSSNFAAFMQTHGFQMDGKAYLDGPFNSVDWTNAAALNGAIANVGPVKIGVASANLAFGPHGQVTPGTSGGRSTASRRASLKITARAFAATGPGGVGRSLRAPRGKSICRRACLRICYAMFTWGSIGVVDRQSLMNITGEAWVRNPTTIVKNLGG